ncbi:hypothetical protein V8C86DRAFT_2737121, partial [Haematococcus lacustris]
MPVIAFCSVMLVGACSWVRWVRSGHLLLDALTVDVDGTLPTSACSLICTPGHICAKLAYLPQAPSPPPPCYQTLPSPHSAAYDV